MRRVALALFATLLAADAGLMVWSIVGMLQLIDAPDDLVPGLVRDSLLAVMTVAVAATYLVAIVLAGVDLLLLVRKVHQRWVWFILAVLATLLGLPDVVIVMLAGRALFLPASLIFLLLAPAATFVAAISTAAAGLAHRPPQ